MIVGFIVYTNPDLFKTQAILFPDQTDSGKVIPTQTSYIEGDILNLKLAVPGEYKGSAIWIDGKKYGCDYGCIWGCQPYGGGWKADWCSTNTQCNTPQWGFDYGSTEIPLELTAGTHVVEGWASAVCPIYTECPGIQYATSTQCSPFYNYFRFTINVAPLPCLLQPNQLIAAELFGEGQTVSQSALRYPIAQLCSEHPIKVYEKNSRTFRNRYDLFTQLKNNENLVVPSGESWMVFYIIDINPEIPAICDPTLYYDVEKKICTDVSGILTVCSYGTFDPSRGLCVVQADSVEPFCEIGRYDLSLGKCIYNPVLYPLCDFCSNFGCSYNYATDRCEYNAPLDTQCPLDYLLENEKCVKYPERTISCPESYEYNSTKNACIKYAPTIFDCIQGGVYENGICIVKIENPICPNGVLSEDKKSCIISPNYQTSSCVQGTFSTEKNACIITPNLDYLCTIGTLSEDKTSCVIYAQTVIKCQTGYVYEESLGKCVSYPEGIIKCTSPYVYVNSSGMCEYHPSLFSECSKGTLNEEKGICEYNPSVMVTCPTGSSYSAEQDKCIKSMNTTIITTTTTTTTTEDKTTLYVILGIMALGLVYLIFKRK